MTSSIWIHPVVGNGQSGSPALFVEIKGRYVMGFSLGVKRCKIKHIPIMYKYQYIDMDIIVDEEKRD